LKVRVGGFSSLQLVISVNYRAIFSPFGQQFFWYLGQSFK
jgi:hypothetical protein